MATGEEGLSNKELQPEPSADPQVLAIATQFLTQYYQIFDSNRAGLAALYVSVAMKSTSIIVHIYIFLFVE